eukprot:scaffold14488_cov131-Isochrysis_galbana.AAC.14
MSISSYASDLSAASLSHSCEFTQSNPSPQSGMVQPVVNEMFATVHAAGSSLLGLFTSVLVVSQTYLVGEDVMHDGDLIEGIPNGHVDAGVTYLGGGFELLIVRRVWGDGAREPGVPERDDRAGRPSGGVPVAGGSRARDSGFKIVAESIRYII